MSHPPSVRYRTVATTEADAVAELHARSWRNAYRGLLSDEYLDHEVFADRSRVWAMRFRAPAGTVTVGAYEAEQLVGFAHAIVDDDAEWGTLLDNLHVAPHRTRNGVGRRLMHESGRRLVEIADSPRLYLWVLESNHSARAFYDSLGGTPTGTGRSCDGGADLSALRYSWADLADLVERSAPRNR